VGIGNTTWEEFVAFLYDLLTDKDNRELDTASKLENAKQRENQSVEAFAIHLETLERELGIVDDAHRQRTLFGKLTDDLKARILRHGEVPRSRKALVSLARRIESAERIISNSSSSTKGATRNPRRGADVPAPAAESGTPAQRPAAGNTQGDSKGTLSEANRTPIGTGKEGRRGTIRCYRCSEEGHLSPKCPNIECYNCKKKGHISTNCSEPRQGNGGARS
jgi:hypothetical protein